MTDTPPAPENEDAPSPPAGDELDQPDADESSGFSPSSWEIVAGIVLLVAAIVIIVVLTGGDDGDDEVSTATSVPVANVPTSAGGGPGGAPGSTGLPPETPRSPLPTEEVAADDFDRENSDSLGEATTGQKWVEEQGSWGIRDDTARVIEAREDGNRQIALLDPENVYMNNGTVTVGLEKAAPGAGIVFRYRDPFNYFVLAGQVGENFWRIEKVVKGESKQIATVPVPATGEVEVTLQLRGLWIDVYYDDEPVTSVRDEDLPLAGIVGLFAGGEAVDAGAAFDSFVVGEAEQQLSDLPEEGNGGNGEGGNGDGGAGGNGEGGAGGNGGGGNGEGGESAPTTAAPFPAP